MHRRNIPSSSDWHSSRKKNWHNKFCCLLWQMPNPNTERPPVLVVLETVPGTFCTSRLGVESPAPRHTWKVLAPKSLHPPLPETSMKGSFLVIAKPFLSIKPIHIAQKVAFSEKKSGPLLIPFYLHGIQGSLTKKKQHFEEPPL